MVENLQSESYYLWRSLYLIFVFIITSTAIYFVALYTYLFRMCCEMLRNENCCKSKCSIMNLAEKVSRTASKTYLGAPLGLFNKDLSDNKELCINGQEISQLTLLMLGSYVYFAVIATITITWVIFIIDYSATCDDNFDCFFYDKNTNKFIAITDCSIVNDSSTIDCYKIAHNTNALAAAGGLITIFKVIPLIISSILLKLYYYCALSIEKCFKKRIMEIRFFKAIGNITSSDKRRILLMLLLFSLFWFLFTTFFAFIQYKYRMDPSTSLKVLWLSLAIMLSMLIPWENYISPRYEEYEHKEYEPINA